MTDPTPTPTPLDLAALTMIANAATEGPWHERELPDLIGNCTSTIHAPNAIDVPTWSELAPEIAGALKGEDARHIAAFDPTTARALIARAEAAEAKIAAVRRVIETAYIRNEAGNEVAHVDDVKFALAGEHV